MIAMALLPAPKLIIADEPTTALDVTIQAQILKLLRQLARETGVSVLFTTHDLGAAWEICDRVTVMYAGQVLETAPIEAFARRPMVPYTSMLLDSLPSADTALRGILGDLPNLVAPANGLPLPPTLPASLRHLPHDATGAGRGPAEPPGVLPSSADAGRRGMKPLLQVMDLHTHFPIRDAWGRLVSWLRALDGVSLSVAPGEILGVVGESGCGKTTLGKTIAGIHRATAGSIRFAGNEIAAMTRREGSAFRRGLQYCYQDPGASLDPHWKIGRALAEPLIIHTKLPAAERDARVREVIAAVGLPEGHLDLYPHEISGGQQRRVGLARILMVRPDLIVLDEPTSGLDVSVQAIVLRLFLDLRARFGLTYLFISHDLAVVRLVSQRIVVMYLGKVVETGPTEQVFAEPRHPYTQSLLAAVPVVGGRRVTDDFWLEGEPPNPGSLPSGCRFRTRCPRAEARCSAEEPVLRTLPGGSEAACHFAE